MCVRCIYHTTVAGYINSGNKVERLSIEIGAPYGVNKNDVTYEEVKSWGGNVCTYYNTVFSLLHQDCTARDIG